MTEELGGTILQDNSDLYIHILHTYVNYIDLNPNQLGSSKNGGFILNIAKPGLFRVRKVAFTQLAWTCMSPEKAGLHWLGVSHIPQEVNLVQSCI